MTDDRKIDGPVYDLKDLQAKIRSGELEVVHCGKPPPVAVLQGKVEPDYTIESVELMDPFQVNYQMVSAGYGQLYFRATNGKIYCDNETMSKDFIRSVFNKLVDDLILVDDPKAA